jgi:hypothetical protein
MPVSKLCQYLNYASTEKILNRFEVTKMFCDQCPEVLSGKGCTKNGPCKKQRVEPPKTESQGKESDLGLPARLKGIMGFFKKKH